MFRLAVACLATSTFILGRLEPTRQASSSVVRRLAAPTSRPLQGFVAADCVEVSADVRVCKAQRTRDDSLEIVLLASGREVMSWESGYPVWAGMFDVRVADLDADGSDELLITDHVSTSNGMAVTYHRAIIVDRYESARRSALSFDLEEFCTECEHGTYVPQPGRRGVAILTTEWTWGVSSIDRRRPPGNYVVGRWFTYARGRLRPRPGVVARRYLDSFVDVRHQGDARPASWFTGLHARPLPRDPATGNGRVVRSRRGVIDEHGRTAHGDSYTVRSEREDLIRLGVGWIPDSVEFRGWESIDAVGLVDGATVLPRGVSPTVAIGDLSRRRVRLDEYQDGDRTRRVLWIH